MNESANNQSFTDQEIDLRTVFYDLLAHKWIILTFVLVALTLGSIYAIVKTPLYSGDVLLQVKNDQKGGSEILGDLVPQLNLGSGKDPASVQTALIRSRFILEPVISSLGLDIKAEPYHFPVIGRLFTNSKAQIEISKLEVPSASIKQRLTLVIDRPNHFVLHAANGQLLLQGNIGEEVTTKDHTFTINVKNLTGSVGSKFTVIKDSNAAVLESLTSKLKIIDIGNSLGVADKTGVLRLSLVDKDSAQVVSILNTIANITQQKDAERKSLEAEKTLQFLYQQLPLVKAALEKAEVAMNNYRAQSGKIDIRLQSRDLLIQLADLDKDLEAARLSKLEMLQQYTAVHPFIIALDQRIKKLAEEQTQLQNSLKALPASDQIAVNYMRDVRVKNDLYLILLNKIQEFKVMKAGTISDVRILSLATLPDEPLSSGTPLILMASLILGLILGCLSVMGYKTFTHKVEDPHWLERHLNVMNLSILPYSKHQSTNGKSFKTSKAKFIPLLAVDNPRDLTLEALRSLRTSLQVTLCTSVNNIIAILGISPGVGKSFVSANFAYVLAQAGKRTLLIDGDIRRGHLQNYFDTTRMPGLTELINQKVTIEDVLRKTPEDNLTFLPAGTFPADPAELLMSNRFKELMTIFSQMFDLVVIDTAPILAVTDGALIGAQAGTNFLVLGSNSHQPEEIEVAMKQLINAGIKLNGSIYNHTKPEPKIYGNSRYNYYYDYNKTE